MGTYEARGRRSKKGDGAEVRPHFLQDKLLAALFVHHRHLLPRELEARLLPMVVPQPLEEIDAPVSIVPDRRLPKVIYLKDRSDSLPFVPHLPPKRRASQIIKDVCERRGITLVQFFGLDRRRQVSNVRQEACYYIAKETDMSLPAIGRFIKKDHSTVMHAINQFCHRHDIPHPRRKQREHAMVREARIKETA